MVESFQCPANMLRTPEINAQAGVRVGLQVVHEFGVDFDCEQMRSPGQGPQDGPGGAAGAGPKLHHHAGMGDAGGFDNASFQETGARDDGPDQSRLTKETAKEDPVTVTACFLLRNHGVLSLDETLDCGEDTGTPVTEAYKVPFKFTGEFKKVTIYLAPAPLTAADQRKLYESKIAIAGAQ